MARIIIEDAREQGVKIMKTDIAVALRELILSELEAADDERKVTEHRSVLALALAIGRYSF